MKILNFILFMFCLIISGYMMVMSFLKISEEFTIMNIFYNVLSYIVLLTCIHLNRRYLKRFYPKKN